LETINYDKVDPVIYLVGSSCMVIFW